MLRLFFLAIALFTCGCATTTHNLTDTLKLKDQAIECNSRDSICGVWEVHADGASWQMAIVPTNEDGEWNYHGIILSLSRLMSGPFSVGELMVKLKKSDGAVLEGCQVWKNALGMSFGCSSAEFGMTSKHQFVQVNHFAGPSAIGKTWNATLIEPKTRTAGSGEKAPDHYPQPDGESIGLGTCFAVSPDGYLVTNNHVIKDAKQIYVRMSNGESLPATVITTAPSTDLAILKIEATDIPYLSFASSKKVGLGERVFTIGYPLANMLGTDPKYTEGVVSSKSGLAGEAIAFQITVPIQPGNSGGPLVNQQGKVVGVITSTASSIAFFRESGNLPQNINWAVKSDYASMLVDDIPERAQTKTREEAISNTEKAIGMVLTRR